jgi:hypothetical protein
MELLKKEILAEKLREKPNARFIQRLQVIADKSNELTFNDFDSLGRFEPREAFIERDNLSNDILHKDCTDVVRYIDKYYVQALKDNWFYVNVGTNIERGYRFEKLSDAVRFLWDNQVSKARR